MELLKEVSQILELHFFILSHFSQNWDSSHLPWFDITHLICHVSNIVQWSLITVSGSLAFKWTSNVSSRIYKCPNDDVILPWNYVTDDDKSVMGIFWHSEKNGTIASYLGNHYMSSSNRVEGIIDGNNAGLQLSKLTENDAGLIGVQVLLTTVTQPYEQETELVIVREYCCSW